MNLKDLYEQTPVSQHASIVVSGDRVYVRTDDGTDEYLLRGQELVLMRSDKLVEERITKRLETSLGGRMGDIAKIKAKLGA